MDDLDIRLMMLRPTERRRIKQLMLSEGDDDLLDAVAGGLRKSANIARELCLSTTSVSSRLKTLFEKGYLKRERNFKGIGGNYEYEYWTVYKSPLETEVNKPMNATQFNETYPVNSSFLYQPIKGIPTGQQCVKTRSEAWDLPSGDTIVKVTGKTGSVDVTHLFHYENLKD